MFNSLDTLLIFTLLAAFSLWGGAAIGAGIRGRRALPVLWGILIGGAPLYFGIERVVTLDEWLPLACQLACLAGAAVTVGLALPRLRAFFLKEGMNALMIGTFIMVAAAVLGAWLLYRGAETVSLIVGGIGFLFGAMWFGAGIQQLRGK
jgi:sorbitol-specific phosphotransferase system component IIBC